MSNRYDHSWLTWSSRADCVSHPRHLLLPSTCPLVPCENSLLRWASSANKKEKAVNFIPSCHGANHCCGHCERQDGPDLDTVVVVIIVIVPAFLQWPCTIKTAWVDLRALSRTFPVLTNRKHLPIVDKKCALDRPGRSNRAWPICNKTSYIEFYCTPCGTLT